MATSELKQTPFCQIPQATLTALAGHALSGAEFQVVLAILYELHRWQPDGAKPKAIGAWDFQQFTNLGRRTVKRSIKSLEQQGIIQVERQPERRKVSVYSINAVDWWRSRHYPKALASVTHATRASDVQDTSTSDVQGPQLVSPTSPLRNNGKKEEIQEPFAKANAPCKYHGPEYEACDFCRVSATA